MNKLSRLILSVACSFTLLPTHASNNEGTQLTSRLKGRNELAKRFGAFLDRFDVVYHINGQQTVKLDGDKASGIAYCQVVLVGMENGRKTMTTQGVRYDDEYVRQNGKWFINKRTSHFEWTNKQGIEE